MRNFGYSGSVFDRVFIVAAAIVLILLNRFGYSYLVSKFSLVFVMIAFFAGKFSRNAELDKESEKNEEEI